MKSASAMPWQDTPTSFGVVSIALHWLNALLIVALLTTGFMAWPLPRGPERSALLTLHVSLALLLLPFAVTRIVWRIRHGKPETQHRSVFLGAVAGIVWRVLLVGIALQLITGPLLVWMHGRPLELFGLIAIPSPLPHMEEMHRILVKPAHQTVSIIITTALLLHVLGALKHFLIDRDGVLQRMLMTPRSRDHLNGNCDSE